MPRKKTNKTKTRLRTPVAQEFLDSLDWDELRKEFFETYAEDGTYEYKTLRSFAREKWPYPTSKASNPRVIWFMSCVGTQPVESYKHRGDWESERLTDVTKLNSQLMLLKAKIASELDLLDAGKVLAESYLPLQQKIHSVWAQIEAHFGGNLIQPVPKGSTEKEQIRIENMNLRRLSTYMKAISWVTDAKTKVDNQFLHMLGWDRPQFILQWAQIHEDNKKKGLAATEDTGVTNLLMQLARDQIVKSEMYELPLPDDIKNISDKVKQS